VSETAHRTLPAPPPVVNVETKRFWDATSQSKLLLPRCTACGTVIWYPRAFCPECSSFDVTWFEASGRLAVGQPVEVVFHPTANGAALPRFRPM
jgi:hypothetical protein